MNTLKPIIFLFPAIAIILCALLFSYLLKKTHEKYIFKFYTSTVFVIAFILNLYWELAQLNLYKNAVYDISHISFCSLGSIADAIMVTLIYLLFSMILKNEKWIENVHLYQISIMVILGAVGAVLSEKRHLSIGTWEYSNLMPLIPILNVGLSPVLQFILLPGITYFLSFKYINNQLKK